MYSSTGSAEQSRESVNASYDVLNSRLMPRAGNTADEELVFRSDSRSSKTSQNQQYMNTLSTGQKARNTLNASQTRVNSPGASTTSVNQQHTGQPRSQSSTGHYPSGPKPGRLPSRASSGAPGHPGGTANSSGSSEDSMKQKQMNHQRGRGGGSAAGASMMAKRREATVDARGFLRTLNDLFFSKFCVDELFYREFREQLVKRIQESTYRYDPEDLQDILDDVSEACKSTRLNLDAVSQWRLNYFTRDQTASVVDYIFLINVNMMAFDAKYSNRCLDSFCADPLCSEIHAGRVSEEDRAKAFRRVINVIMNEAVRVRLVTREQKSAVRARLVKSVFSCEDRINAIREIAVLILLAQDDRHRDFVQYALVNFGQTWAPSDASMTDVDEDCNLDPDMVYRKALGAINNTYLESILDVRRLGMSISVEEVAKLRELWARASTKVPTAAVVTLPMLLHLLVHCSESELQDALPQAGVSAAALAKTAGGSGLTGRIEQVEDAALQIVQNLGLAWELGDNPPRDLRQFCMVLLLDLGSVLSMLLVAETQPSDQPDSDQQEIGTVEDGLFARWWDVCDAVVTYERAHRHFYVAFLITYIKVASEKLLAQKADFNPELFLTMVVELLTEFRKRRPDYEAIVITADGRVAPSCLVDSGTASARSSGGDAASGGSVAKHGKALDRRTREDIGAEFDRLFAWVDQQLPVTNRVRALSRAQSPRSKTNSWQQAQSMPRSTSSASVGYGSATGGNRVASPVPPMPMPR